MALGGPGDYTTRDKATILAALARRLQTSLPTLDLSPGSPDRALLEAFADLGGDLSFVGNSGTLETFLGTARLRRSVIEHGRLMGYTLRSASAAEVPVTIQLARRWPEAVPIAAGTRIESDDGTVGYETLEDAVVAAGDLAVAVDAQEGRTVTESTAGLAPLDAPRGQRFALGQRPFLDGSDAVVVNGVPWTRKSSLLNSGPSDAHYVVLGDGQDGASIALGDGVNGLRPSVGATIAVRYRIGGGVAGRVKRGRLAQLVGTLRTASGLQVEATASNLVDSSGGDDRETIAHAQLAIPESVRATERTVAREDFAFHAAQVDGVARALCHTHLEDPTIPWLLHRVYVVPVGGGIPTQDLLDAVEAALTTTFPRGALDAVQVVGAIYADQVVGATLVLRANVDTAAVLAAAQAAVLALYDPTAITKDASGQLAFRRAFGAGVPRSELIAALQDVPGVAKVTLTAPGGEPSLSAWEFPALSGAPTLVV